MNDDNFVNTEVDSDQTVQTNECPRKNKFGKKLVKGIIRGIAAVFILLLLLIIILLTCRDTIIHNVITKGGSLITGVEISLDKFETSLTDGELKILNLKIANPKNYDKQYLLELDSLFFSLDLNSLGSDEIIINEIDINGLRAVAEFNRIGKFNIVELTENIQQKFASSENEPTSAPANESATSSLPEAEQVVEEESPQKSVVINKLTVSNSNAIICDDRVGIPVSMPLVYASNDLMFKQTGKSIVETLNDFAKDMEKSCSGVANAGELVLDTGKQLLDTTGNAGKQLLDSTGNASKQLLDSTGNTSKQLLDSTGNAGKQLSESGKKLLDAFKF